MNGRSNWLFRLLGLVAAVVVLVVLGVVATGCTLVTTSQGVTTTSASAGTVTTGPSAVVPPPAFAEGASPAEAVAERLGPSVVNLKVEGMATGVFGQQRFSGQGSGVIFSSDGMIVTNNHVVTQNDVPADTIVVTFATGEQAPATLVGRDRLTDLAVVRVEKSGLRAAEFVTNMAEVRVGQWAIAIGSPLGFDNSITLGIVSGLMRQIPPEVGGDQALIDLIQTDAAISPGNSGGALADAQGRVIGVNVAYLPPGRTGAQDVGFAIPANTVVDVAEQLIATGRAVHPYIGIVPRTVTPDLQSQFGLSRSSGLIVAEVEPGTPGDQAGLEQGDIIVSIDGQTMVNAGDLFSLLRTKRPGDSISVFIDRNGTEQTVIVMLGERPRLS
jgi:serine protease Do